MGLSLSLLSRGDLSHGTQRRRSGALEPLAFDPGSGPRSSRSHQTILRYLLLLLALGPGLDLAACSTPLPPLPPLPSLHVPGVVQLDAVAALEAKTGDRTIRSALTYQRPVETGSDRHPATTLATHVLYLEEGALYVIHLDGSGLHRIAMQTSCYFLGGLDPTGQHGLCWNGQGVQAFGLDEAAISLTPRELVPSNYAYGDVLTYPTLAPDGKHFAALERLGTGAPAAIALYAVDPSFTTAERVATITVPGMAARRLSWSPDGRRPGDGRGILCHHRDGVRGCGCGCNLRGTPRVRTLTRTTASLRRTSAPAAHRDGRRGAVDPAEEWPRPDRCVRTDRA